MTKTTLHRFFREDMNLLKDWNKFEKILLFGGITLVAIVAFIFKTDKLTTICSIVGISTALLQAKGKSLGQVFGLLISILYSIVSFQNKFYGEVSLYLFLILPMYVASVISWYRHPNKTTNSVDINRISKNEWSAIGISSIFITAGIYFLLKSFNTNELIVSTISVVTNLFAIYLQFRRSRFSFYFYIINDVVRIVLWGIPVILGNMLLIPMVFYPVINLINDSYGVHNWKKLEKRQSSNS